MTDDELRAEIEQFRAEHGNDSGEGLMLEGEFLDDAFDEFFLRVGHTYLPERFNSQGVETLRQQLRIAFEIGWDSHRDSQFPQLPSRTVWGRKFNGQADSMRD